MKITVTVQATSGYILRNKSAYIHKSPSQTSLVKATKAFEAAVAAIEHAVVDDENQGEPAQAQTSTHNPA